MTENIKIPLLGKTLSELQEICHKLGFENFKAKQIAHWLYKKEIDSISQMTNLSKLQREKLQASFNLGISKPIDEQISRDGTRKYLFALAEENTIETVYIPEAKRHTVCVSSQCGCKRNCSFCFTGKIGFKQDIDAASIINQIRSIPQFNMITNIVFMGMGEPLDNLDEVLKSIEILTEKWGFAMSPKRITVSTIGILPQLQLLLEKQKCNIAVSVHSPFEKEREVLVPTQKQHKIKEIIRVIRNYPIESQRRVSFEYILFDNYNDSINHADALIKLLKGIRCRINLIQYHKIQDVFLKKSRSDNMYRFRERLTNKGIIATIRRSRGEDIFAACGMLANVQKK